MTTLNISLEEVSIAVESLRCEYHALQKQQEKAETDLYMLKCKVNAAYSRYEYLRNYLEASLNERGHVINQDAEEVQS